MNASANRNPSAWSWKSIAIIAIVVLVLASAFYWLEQDHSRLQMKVLRDERQIYSVEFTTEKVTERHWYELRPAATTLKTLDLSRTTSVADGLAGVRRFIHLESLQLTECPWVDDAELQQLAGLELLHLNLAGTPVTRRGVAALDLSRLQTLDLTGCRGINDAATDLLHEAESLTRITLEGTSITLDGFERLRMALPQTKLHLKEGTLLRTFCEVEVRSPWLENRAQIDSLLRFFAIPHEWSSGTYAPPGDAPFMALKGPAVGPALADILAAIPNSDTVILSQTSIPGGFEAASDALRRVEFGELTGDIDLSSLAAVKSLESLAMYSTTIPEGELHFLLELPVLKSLELIGCQVAEADLLTVTQCPSLEWISLSGVFVSDEAGLAIARLPNLQRLLLSGTTISPQLPEKIRQQSQSLDLQVSPRRPPSAPPHYFE